MNDVQRCGYSKCRAELPAPGPQGGRRRAFCRDTRWEGGRTCAQMARAERDALDALGLDSSRAAFGLDADRLREHVDAVRGPVEALVARSPPSPRGSTRWRPTPSRPSRRPTSAPPRRSRSG